MSPELLDPESLGHLLAFELAASVAVVAVLLARGLVRSRYGAQAAYALWLAPLLAAAALLPAPEAAGGGVTGGSAWLQAGSAAVARDGGGAVVAVWLLGAMATAGAMAVRHLLFLRRAGQGRAGPAMVGLFNPRLMVPGDFHARFTAEERAMVRAHERAHVERGDPRAGALAGLLLCLNWFNPLAHVAVRRLREDQELACDAHVAAQAGVSRRRYAETLLKSQLAADGSPLACAWTGARRHPLEARVRGLAAPPPSVERRYEGRYAALAFAVFVALLAWRGQPPVARHPWAEAGRPVLYFLSLAPRSFRPR